MNALTHDRSSARLTPEQFKLVAKIAHREAGLVLVESKSAMISSRLVKRLRACSVPDLQGYCELVSGSEGGKELPYMISALTTNVSHFFREMHHFETLRDEVLPRLLQNRGLEDPIRVWSAGCSNGQELYSIAMIIDELCPNAADQGLKILGTDIDLSVIEYARNGIYDQSQMNGVPVELRNKYFESISGERYQVISKLREMIKINHLNLIQPWPMKSKFDVIFCRNVVIYFDEELQRKLWQRFTQAMRPDGWLFIGHSERIGSDEKLGLKSCGLTAYRMHSSASNLVAQTGH